MRSQTRHQLKQDQFAERAKEAVSWTVEHRDKLIYGGIAIAAAVAIILGVWFYTQQQDEAAGVALGHAIQVYNAPIQPGAQTPAGETTSFASAADRARAAKAEFQKVAGSYPRTRSGQIARYFVGLTDVDLGNNADAEKELKASADSGRADLAALAKFALASLYRKTGKESEAVKLYKDLVDHPSNTVAKATAQLELASLYEPKQPKEARLIYEQIQKEDPRGPAAEIAANRLSNLK